MSLVPGWYPPTRQNWELVVNIFQLFPIFITAQWFITWYPQGKTSIESKLNLPGKWAWLVMELPGFLTVLYCMWALPQQLGIASLPMQNWIMAGMYTVHYCYRSWISALFLNPSMSPIHASVFLMASIFNVFNGLSIGGWLAGYGPTTSEEWTERTFEVLVGSIIWFTGFVGNFMHDDVLRDIRRRAQRRQEAQAKFEGKPAAGVKKLYEIPDSGLFHFILYPHYLCEWYEWAGFWLVGGWGCVPARSFLLNEIATMTPRAVQGKQWYIEKFGQEKVGNRKAVIPGLL